MAQTLKRELSDERGRLMARIVLAEAELEHVLQQEQRLLGLLYDARSKLYCLENGLVCAPDWDD